MPLPQGLRKTQSTHQPIDNSPDTFATAWSASTQWKSGASKTQRYISQSEPPDPNQTHGTLIGPTTPPPRKLSSYPFDKPLPPLPFEAFQPPEDCSRQSTRGAVRRNDPRYAATPTRLSFTDDAILPPDPSSRSVKRKPLFSFGLRKSKPQKRQSESQPPEVLQPVNRRPEMTQLTVQLPPRELVASVMVDTLLMVDSGTQTTPTLEKRYLEFIRQKTIVLPKLALPDAAIRGAPTAKVQLPKAGRDISTPSAGLKTPPWSPRELLNVSGPYDYFDLPLEKVEDIAGESPGSNISSETTRYYPRYYKRFGSTSPRRKSDTDASDQPIDDYQSQYSERPFDKGNIQLRPSISRTGSAETTQTTLHIPQDRGRKSSIPPDRGRTPSINDKTTLATPIADADPPSVPIQPPSPYSRVSFDTPQPTPKSPSQPRPVPILFQKKSHHGRSSSRPRARRESSGSSPSSPLRQEYKLPEPAPDRTDFERQPSFGFFRIPIFGASDHLDSPEQDVPEHFVGSPLCPMHPKHKSGGLGTCPYHGRRKFSTDSPGASIARRLSSIDDGEEDIEDMWGAGVGNYAMKGRDSRGRAREEEAHQFRLSIEDHDEDSVNCPANPLYQGLGSKGVCIYHGRAKRRMVDSDESVPRVKW